MNIIVNAFAFKEEYGGSMQLGDKSDIAKIDLYMKNIVVSLVSAKRANKRDVVALVTNREVPEKYSKILENEGVRIKQVPFDSFLVPKEFPWSLAFYKLKVLEYLVNETDYERILLVDTDTYFSRSVEEIWQEADYGLILHNIGHSFNHKDRMLIRNDYKQLYANEHIGNLIHYGGEFICGIRDDLADFIAECRKVFERVKNSGFKIAKGSGDEAIISMAAVYYREKKTIYEATAYIYRYWTGEEWYLASTNYINNPVSIWHLPSEKDRGMLMMFKYFKRHKGFPDTIKAAKMMGLVMAKRPGGLISLRGRLIRHNTNKK